MTVPVHRTASKMSGSTNLHSRPVKVTVVGTSFIRRLRDDILKVTDSSFERNFGIPKVEVRFVCKGAWYLPDVQENLERIAAHRPDIVILQCGGNDLCHTDRPERLAHELLKIAEKIEKETSAVVLVCQILKRDLGKYFFDKEEVEWFNQKVGVANQFLKVVAEEYKNVKFWKHHGMSEPQKNILCPDGVHMNAHGQFKFYRSLRGALLFGTNMKDLAR